MVIRNEFIRDFPENKLSMDLGALVFKHYEHHNEKHLDKFNYSHIKFAYIFRGAKSNKVIAEISDRKAGFVGVASNKDFMVMNDAILCGAKALVESRFRDAFRCGDKHDQIEIIKGTIPNTFGAIKYDGDIYILTYIFVDDRIMEERRLISDIFSVCDVYDLRDNYDLTQFSHILIDQFIPISDNNIEEEW